MRRIVRRPSVPARRDVAALNAPTAALLLSELARAGSALESFAGMRPALAEIERFTNAANAFRIPASVGRLFGSRRSRNGFPGHCREEAIGYFAEMRDRQFDMAIMRPPLPARHDPEAFYYEDWPPDVAVKRGALTCDLFRHRANEELFAFEILLPEDSDVSGAVQCKVEAENLTEPVTRHVQVSRAIERYDLLEAAEALVASCR